VIGGEIYVPGGKQADGSATNVLEVYDPQRDIWQEKSPLPIPIYGYALASFEGRIYLFGGTDGSQYLNSVYIYDPTQDTWQQVSPMPTARAYSGAAEAGGKIYVIGGWDGEKAVDVNEVYVPDQDQSGDQPWATEGALPEPQYAFGMQGIGEIIFLVGKSTIDQYTLLQFLPEWSVDNHYRYSPK
jgi:N-acetylneuraminic acid mutarotase